MLQVIASDCLRLYPYDVALAIFYELYSMCRMLELGVYLCSAMGHGSRILWSSFNGDYIPCG